MLKENNIAYVGGGANPAEAKKPYIFESHGRKIGVYACCEHEFSLAEDYGCGCNGFDPVEAFDDVAELKKRTDFVIVLYHGGKENYRYPSPYIRKICRKLAEKGAGLVICQHTHCIGCRENYMGAELVYGQGNLFFDYISNEYWDTSLVVAVDEKNGFKVEYIPVEKDGNYRKLSDDPSIIRDFLARSREIEKDGVIEKKYSEISEKSARVYLNYLSGCLNDNVLKSPFRAAILNFIDCEAHREAIIRYLKSLCIKK